VEVEVEGGKKALQRRFWFVTCTAQCVAISVFDLYQCCTCLQGTSMQGMLVELDFEGGKNPA
jgi:hypothetical protein